MKKSLKVGKVSESESKKIYLLLMLILRAQFKIELGFQIRRLDIFTFFELLMKFTQYAPSEQNTGSK